MGHRSAIEVVGATGRTQDDYAAECRQRHRRKHARSLAAPLVARRVRWEWAVGPLLAF